MTVCATVAVAKEDRTRCDGRGLSKSDHALEHLVETMPVDGPSCCVRLPCRLCGSPLPIVVCVCVLWSLSAARTPSITVMLSESSNVMISCPSHNAAASQRVGVCSAQALTVCATLAES